MDFTREPTVETIITPKEGCKIVVRNSKILSQTEEYFVDAVEVVSFGRSIFFRCLEKPKPFLVPATDYEILEVREARMVLKSGSHERNIKIAGGKKEAPVQEDKGEEPKQEKKRERKQSRRRKQRPKAEESVTKTEESDEVQQQPRSLLPPPSTLISETLSRYRESEDFKKAFYTPEEEDPAQGNGEQDEFYSQKFDEALEQTTPEEV